MSGARRRRNARADALMAIHPEIDECVGFWQWREPDLVVGGGTTGDLRIARALARRFPDHTRALAHWRFRTARRDRMRGRAMAATPVVAEGEDRP